jgi:hypothetical protein
MNVKCVLIVSTNLPQSLLILRRIQLHILNNIEKWFQKWKLKINKNKSTHITFFLQQGQRLTPPIYINRTTVPHEETVNPLTFKNRTSYI